MNNKLHTYLKKAGEEMSLTHDERARMRRTLHAYMEMKPLRAETRYSRVMWDWNWLLSPRPVAVFMVLALFVSSAGISYAAESALPGDFLYEIKTRVNEPLVGALSASASAKTAWAMDVAGERVKEAATLAAEGRLSTTTQAELRTSFESHAGQALASIAEEAGTSPETGSQNAVRFEAQLSEYERVLTQVGAAKNIDVASLASSVQAERAHVTAIRTRAHVAATGDAGAVARMGAAAREQLNISSELARAVSKSLSASSAELVAAQLNSASNAISDGKDFTEKRATSDALNAFQNALTATEKLGVFLETSSAIHARTGRIIEEPRKEQPGTKTQRVNKSGRTDSIENETRAPATASKSIIQPSATTTSTDEGGKTSTHTTIQTHAEENQGAEIPDLPVLPLSVPTNVLP